MKTAFVALITLFMLHTVSEAADDAMPLPALLQHAGLAGAQAFVGFAYLRGAVVKRVPEIAFGYFKAACATPGLQLITAADLKSFWRSDHYGALSKGVLSRPAFVISPP